MMTPLLARVHIDYPGNPLLLATDGWFGNEEAQAIRFIISWMFYIAQSLDLEFQI
jgi:hypothetical protein